MAKLTIDDLPFSDSVERERFIHHYQNFTPNENLRSSLEQMRQMVDKPGPAANMTYGEYLDAYYRGGGLRIPPQPVPQVNPRLWLSLLRPDVFQRLAYHDPGQALQERYLNYDLGNEE